MSSFADRLREVMIEQGWTQQALGNKCDVSQATVGGWLSGESEPYPRNLARLSISTGVSRDWLLYGEGRKMMRPNPGAPSPAIREEEGDDDTRAFVSKVIFLRQLASREQREMLDAYVEALQKVIHIPTHRPSSHYEGHTFETTKPVKTASATAAKKPTRYSKTRRAAKSKSASADPSQSPPAATPRGTQGRD